MKDEYNFTDAEQGRLYRSIEELEGLRDKNTEEEIIDSLMKKPLRISNFKPVAREEIYHRSYRDV